MVQSHSLGFSPSSTTQWICDPGQVSKASVSSPIKQDILGSSFKSVPGGGLPKAC